MTEPTPLPAYEEAERTARDGAPFSNSTDGDAWLQHHCGRCRHDVAGDCPLVLLAVTGRTPSQWEPADPADLRGRWTCCCFTPR